MKYSIKISCEDQARVINFTSELQMVMVFDLFRAVVKENYSLHLSPYHKKHRGKAVSLEEALKMAQTLRFFKIDTVVEYEDIEYFEELFTLNLPYCHVYQSLQYWGTFFKITPTEEVDIKPDMNKIASIFEKHGLDLQLASSGNYYTHTRIKFTKTPGIISSKFTVLKVHIHREVKYSRKQITL